MISVCSVRCCWKHTSLSSDVCRCISPTTPALWMALVFVSLVYKNMFQLHLLCLTSSDSTLLQTEPQEQQLWKLSELTFHISDILYHNHWVSRSYHSFKKWLIENQQCQHWLFLSTFIRMKWFNGDGATVIHWWKYCKIHLFTVLTTSACSNKTGYVCLSFALTSIFYQKYIKKNKAKALSGFIWQSISMKYCRE